MTSETPPPLDDEVTVEFATAAAKRFVEAWNSHDPQRLVALCRPDVHWEDPGIPGGQLTGVDALRAWLEENYTALPDLIFEREGPLLLAVDQRSFGQQWRAHGTMRGPFRGMAPTKHPVTFEGVDIHAYRGGALARVRTVYDQLPIAVQLAAAPQPGSALDRLGSGCSTS